MKINKIILSALLFICVSLSYAAPIKNLPITLNQPDGTVINCYVSGDEFFNYIHDDNGYLIIKNTTTDYYTYAIQKGDKFYPTEFIVGQTSPENKGLPNSIDFSQIDTDKLINKFPNRNFGSQKAPTLGNINNIVIFIRFSDQNEFSQPTSYYDDMFNKTGANVNSMHNYYKEVSYNKLSIVSYFYPIPNPGIISYQDSHPRAYYSPSSTAGGVGYSSDNERTTREHTLLKNAVTYVDQFIPDNLIVDGDNDGEVDNVCFIIAGATDGWSELLWPHMWSLYSQTARINGKRVGNYNFQLQNSLTSSSVGVLCHEMFHSLGSPDLYHYTENGISPVGGWDIMENDLNPPQHMGAHMKYKYGNWIDDETLITEDGEYSLQPVSYSENNIFKLKTPKSSNEYFVVEYRKKTSIFENSLPGEGLLVYRIDSRYEGNADGPPDEVYILRPNGSQTANGSIGSANFSADNGRTFINYKSNPKLELTNGTLAGISIYDIGYLNDSITFKVHFDKGIITAQPNGGEILNYGDTFLIQWENFASTSNYKIEYTTNNGLSWNIIADNISSSTKSFNWQIPNISSSKCKVKVSSVNDNSIFDESDSEFTIFPNQNNNISYSGVLKISGFSSSIDVNNNFVYVCSKSSGLNVVDISSPDSMKFVSKLDTDGMALMMATKDSIAYLADGTGGLKVLDIKNPYNINIKSNIKTTEQATDVKIKSNVLFAGYRDSGIKVFNIDNPNLPIETSTITINGKTKFIAVNNNLLAVLTESGKITLFDISIPNNPIEHGNISIDGIPNGIEIKDNYIYSVTSTNSFYVINIENIDAPFFTFTTKAFGEVNGICLYNNLLMVACGSSGILICSLDDPSTPSLIGNYTTDIFANKITADNNGIYVANRSASMYRFSSNLISDIKENNIIPNTLSLNQNYPNPFNPTTTISFTIPMNSDCSLSIYNILGQLINEYKYNNLNAGYHEIVFNASSLASGAYFYSIKYKNSTLTKKMLLIK